MNYYNENDNFAAEWLENLIKTGRIPDGKVDRRSIAEVQADDVRGFTQCHFFAGIGGWPLALQLAGWSPDRPVWTGSCPCQPFSQAGKQKASNDERHLWPEMYRLIKECRPEIVFGEQVASAEVVGSQLEADFVIAIQGGEFARANKLAKRLVASKSFNATPRWVDGIRSDVETANYSLRFRVLGAFSVGAPHKRSRLFWVANSRGEQRKSANEQSGDRNASDKPQAANRIRGSILFNAVGQPNSNGRMQRVVTSQVDGYGDSVESASCVDAVGDTIDSGPQGFAGNVDIGNQSGWIGQNENRSIAASSPWSQYHVVDCLDGKSRRVECGIFEMDDGVPASLGRVQPELVRIFENEVINYAESRKRNPSEELRNLRDYLSSQAFQQNARRFHNLSSPSFLLAFLCQLTGQGWRFGNAMSHPCPGVQGRLVRGVWISEESSRSSRQLQLVGQSKREYSDALRELSSLLARAAFSAWSSAYDANAVGISPLTNSLPRSGSTKEERSTLKSARANRVGRLKGYGNAIVPQVAAEFVMAFMNCKSTNRSEPCTD